MSFEIERKSNGTVTRDKFEKALVDRMMESGAGWDRPIAMIALALMFCSRGLSDVATNIGALAVVLRKGQR